MPRASLTASAAVDGAVFGWGGLPPVTRMTAAITTTRHASQPRTNARPFLVPFSALRIRMKAVSGKGSRVIASPMSRRSSTTCPPAIGAAGGWASHRPGQPGISQVALGGDPSRCDGIDERVVVARVVSGARGGELREGLVEHVRTSRVAGDGDPVSGPGVGPRQRPAAELAVHPHA